MKVEKMRINSRVVGEGLAKAETTVFGGLLQSGERSWQSCSKKKSLNSLSECGFCNDFGTLGVLRNFSQNTVGLC